MQLKYILYVSVLFMGISSYSFGQANNCGPEEEVISSGFEGTAFFNYGSGARLKSQNFQTAAAVGQTFVGYTENNTHNTNLGFWTRFLLPPFQLKVTATQGDLLDRIQLSWVVDALGASPNEGFNIYRDDVFLAEVGPDIRSYNDFNVIAGTPYVYNIKGINGFGEGVDSKTVGFQVPNGVVTGWISTSNGRAVPDAQVTLLPMQGFSVKFDAMPDVAFSIADPVNPFLPLVGQDWTMTFWMNSTTAIGNADVISFNGSTLEIRALPGASGVSVIQGGNNVTANFASNEWHHITLGYEAAANTGRLYIDGVLKDQSAMSNISSPDFIYLGQDVVGADGWNGYLDEFRIYHTLLDELDLGMVMEGTASSTTPFLSHYWKFDEELGKKSFDIMNRQRLYFCGAEFDAERPPVKTAAVTNAEGYYLIEGVSYGTGTTFIAQPEKDFYLRRSLEFNSGEGDHVTLPNFALPPKTTVELWVNNTNAGSSQTMLSKIEGSSTFRIYSELQGGNNEIRIDINGTSQSFGNLPTGFNHLAFTIDSVAGQVSGYINGGPPTTRTYSYPSNWSDITTNWYIGANSDGNTTSDYFNGLIDEVAVYDTLLSVDTILVHAQEARSLISEGLVVYFPIDEGNGNRVNNVGSTFLDFGTIEGAAWSNFAANQETTPHKFTPKTRQVTLNPSVTSVDQVDFTDLSTIPVSGYVRFQGTECFQPNVELLVNGTSFSPPIFTDADGKFLVNFDPGFSGILTPKNEDFKLSPHTYSPASYRLDNVINPIAGILFNNTVKRKISGQVAGGLCKLPILDSLGTSQGTICKIKVSTPDGCLQRIHTFVAGEEDGDFLFDNLPPVDKIILSIIQHSTPAIKTYFEVSGGSELDISLKDTIKNMIYFAPPEVAIVSGLDPYSENCDFTVLDQGSPESITIKMQEVYLKEVCVIDTGSIYIINGLSDEVKDTTISNGSLVYDFVVGEPNPSPPYLKTLQVVGTSLAGIESATTKQAIITGIRNKENSFTSKLPNVPMLVLRDPPGDGSSAFFEKGETICQTTEFHYEDETGFGIGGEVHLGGNVEIGVGVGVITIMNAGPIFDIGINGEFKWNTVTDSSWQTCFTTNKRISTSSDDLLIGKASDIYMGTATNIIFGFADVVYFDVNNCEAKDSIIFNLEADSDFESTYIYTRFQIENFLIPNLTTAAEQEVDPILKEEFEASVLSWIKILDQSDTTVMSTEYPDNISFSAGVTYEHTSISDTLLVTSSGSGSGESGEGSTNIGVTFNSFGFTVSAKVFTGKERSNSSGDQTSNVVTTGYIFSDDDPGDAFSVDIGLDSLYKTPVFKLKAGQSVCPWEEGTANREAPNLEIVPNDDGSSAFLAPNIPANEPAVFQFVLGNLSATNEDWTYGFTSVAANNPYGAVVKLNGQPLNGIVQYLVPFGSSIPITLTVEKGPIEYDYDNLLVALISECEYERNLELGIAIDDNPKFFSDINISAHFIRPCSEVNINVPQQNWVLYNSIETPDVMNITVSGYNLNEADFQLIRLQYRKENGDGAWINVPGTSDMYNSNWKDYDAEPNVLGEIFTQYSWDTNGLSDGNYDIRAVAVCTGDASDKPGFSQVIKGRIDREPPTLLGVPQPSDGVYNVGDEISFTFNQDINCTKLIQADLTQPNNVALYDATTDDLIDLSISCFDNKIILDPNFDNKLFENKIIRAELHNIQDLVGNEMLFEKWEFYVDRNELAWLTDSIELTKFSDESKTIIAKIHNRGGYPVPYSMIDIPDWVHVSPNTGTLVANEIEEISFTVNENVPLGYLSDSIIMRTETGQNPFFMGGDEVLNMAARVICRPDEWILNPDNFNASDYSFSMNFNLSLNIEGVFTTDVEDIVGAYVNGVLRGVSKVQYNPELDNYLAFITVYSNNASGELVEFQIWDASECKLFAPILETFPYVANDIVGTALNPTILNTTGKVLRKIFIHPGWNWISMNLDPVDPLINSSLFSLSNPEGALIKNQTEFSGFSTELDKWIGSLDSISPLDLYQYNSKFYDSLSMVGTLLDPSTVIPVNSGWNWIGYIPNEKLSIADALSSLTPTEGDLIKSQVSFAQYVDNVGWIGNLDYLDAPNGYLLKLSNADALIYPDPQSLIANPSGSTLSKYYTSTKKGKKGSNKNISSTRAGTHWDVDPSQFEHSMNAIAIVVKNDDENVLSDNDEVAVFVGDEVRGSTQAVYISAIDAYMIFMTIYANQEGELLTFRFFDASENEEIVLQESTGFISNHVLGQVDNPKPLHLDESTGLTGLDNEENHLNVFPNPFSNAVYVNFYSDQVDDIELVFTDVYGAIVEQQNLKAKVGMNVIEWIPSARILTGTYFVTLTDANSSYVRKLLYIK